MNHEILTDILDSNDWWRVIRIAVNVLRQREVREVQLEYGFVIELDLAGLPQGQNRTVTLDQVEDAIQIGLRDKTIERRAGSDFSFIGGNLEVMLCNDDDIHFKSDDALAIREISEKLRAEGIIVHGIGGG